MFRVAKSGNSIHRYLIMPGYQICENVMSDACCIPHTPNTTLGPYYHIKYDKISLFSPIIEPRQKIRSFSVNFQIIRHDACRLCLGNLTRNHIPENVMLDKSVAFHALNTALGAYCLLIIPKFLSCNTF